MSMRHAENIPDAILGDRGSESAREAEDGARQAEHALADYRSGRADSAWCEDQAIEGAARADAAAKVLRDLGDPRWIEASQHAQAAWEAAVKIAEG